MAKTVRVTPKTVNDMYEHFRTDLRILADKYYDDKEALEQAFRESVKNIGEVQGVKLTLDRNGYPKWMGVQKTGRVWRPVMMDHHSQAKNSLKQKEIEDFYKANKGKV